MLKLGDLNIKDLKLGTTQVLKVMLGEKQIWNSIVTPDTPIMPNNLLLITTATIDSNSTIQFKKISSNQIFRRWDNGWVDINEGDIIEISYTDRLYLAGFLSGDNTPDIDFTQILINGNSTNEVGFIGNISALFNYNFDDNIIDTSYSYSAAANNLFASSKVNLNTYQLSLDLPIKGTTDLYRSMFEGCRLSSLSTKIDFGDMVEGEPYTFANMFKGVYSANWFNTTLNFSYAHIDCVDGMFEDFINLHTFTLNLYGNAEQSAFHNMLKNSTLRVLHFNTNGNNFYNYACDGMLDGCNKLTDIYIDVEPSQIEGKYCFSAWALNVSDTGTIHLRSDIDLAELQAIDGLIPKGWTVVQDIE